MLADSLGTVHLLVLSAVARRPGLAAEVVRAVGETGLAPTTARNIQKHLEGMARTGLLGRDDRLRYHLTAAGGRHLAAMHERLVCLETLVRASARTTTA